MSLFQLYYIRILLLYYSFILCQFLLWSVIQLFDWIKFILHLAKHLTSFIFVNILFKLFHIQLNKWRINSQLNQIRYQPQINILFCLFLLWLSSIETASLLNILQFILFMLIFAWKFLTIYSLEHCNYFILLLLFCLYL